MDGVLTRLRATTPSQLLPGGVHLDTLVNSLVGRKLDIVLLGHGRRDESADGRGL